MIHSTKISRYEYINNIILFYECFYVNNFWFSLFENWNRYHDSEVKICSKDVLLGYKVQEWTKYVTENVIILYVKKYIYNCKMNDTALNLIACKNFLTSKFKALQMINFKYRSEHDSIVDFITECL